MAALICGQSQREVDPPSQADLVERMFSAHSHDARLINRQGSDLEGTRQNIHTLAKFKHGNWITELDLNWGPTDRLLFL